MPKIKKSKVGYSKNWERDRKFRHWLTSVENDDQKAFCKCCDEDLNAVRSDLEKHAVTQKHRLSFLRFVEAQAGQTEEEVNLRIKSVIEKIPPQELSKKLNPEPISQFVDGEMELAFEEIQSGLSRLRKIDPNFERYSQVERGIFLMLAVYHGIYYEKKGTIYSVSTKPPQSETSPEKAIVSTDRKPPQLQSIAEINVVSTDVKSSQPRPAAGVNVLINTIPSFSQINVVSTDSNRPLAESSGTNVIIDTIPSLEENNIALTDTNRSSNEVIIASTNNSLSLTELSGENIIKDTIPSLAQENMVSTDINRSLTESPAEANLRLINNNSFQSEASEDIMVDKSKSNCDQLPDI